MDTAIDVVVAVSFNVLVLGGSGHFGGRICRALASDAHIRLLVGARHGRRAQALADTLGGEARAVSLDFNGDDFAGRLAGLDVGLVIHTAGPFQVQDWRVPAAAARAGAHYIDLADGRRWVCEFRSAMDEAFRERGLFATSGASTLPALSTAVLDHLAPRFQDIDTIDLCIAPAQQVPRGQATMAAVLGYCGEPVPVWRDGEWQTATGWLQPAWVEFARMARRRAALCDVPDLELLPRRYPSARNVIFRAALEVSASQWALAGLAALRHRRLIPRLDRFAAIVHHLAGVFDLFGSPTGGMVVRVSGDDCEARAQTVAWHVVAPDHCGPEIPCMAAILLARRIARGDVPDVGAFSMHGLSLPGGVSARVRTLGHDHGSGGGGLTPVHGRSANP